MKQFAIILLSLAVGFGIGRFSLKPVAEQAESANPVVVTGEQAFGKSSNIETVQTEDSKGPKVARRNRQHNAGDEFKIDELIVRIGQPLIRSTTGNETCFTLPFEFANVSEGRIYSPRMSDYEIIDNFGNKCDSFYPSKPPGLFSERYEFVGETLKDSPDEIKPGEIGIKYYDFEFPIDTATVFKLNAVWKIADNISYWDTERHRIKYERKAFVGAPSSEIP